MSENRITNLDAIRARSMEEIAKYIFEIDTALMNSICQQAYSGECPFGDEVESSDCINCVKRWLLKERN